MMEDISLLERRQTRIEDAIERLTEISGNLNKMIAVHNEKLIYQERQLTLLEDMLERRREEADEKLKDVYETIRSEDRNIVDCINSLREESIQQHARLADKIGKMEKVMWMYMGAFSVITFLLAYGPNIVKLFITSH